MVDEKKVIEIDQELSPIVPGFLENRRRECTLITELLSVGNMQELYTMGHRLKGSGGSYGFDELSEIGEVLEMGARDADADVITAARKRLEEYLMQITVVYV